MSHHTLTYNLKIKNQSCFFLIAFLEKIDGCCMIALVLHQKCCTNCWVGYWKLQYKDSTVIGVKQEMRLYSRTKRWWSICQYSLFWFITLRKKYYLLYCSFLSHGTKILKEVNNCGVCFVWDRQQCTSLIMLAKLEPKWICRQMTERGFFGNYNWAWELISARGTCSGNLRYFCNFVTDWIGKSHLRKMIGLVQQYVNNYS